MNKQKIKQFLFKNRHVVGWFQILVNIPILLAYLSKIVLPIFQDKNSLMLYASFVTLIFIIAPLAAVFLMTINGPDSTDKYEYGMMIFFGYLEICMYTLVLIVNSPSIPLIAVGIFLILIQPRFKGEKYITIATGIGLFLWGLWLIG